MRHKTLRTMLCPSCAETLDRVFGGTHNRTPKPGDLLVCLTCCAVLQLEDGGLTVIPESQMTIPMIHQLRKLQRTIQETVS